MKSLRIAVAVLFAFGFIFFGALPSHAQVAPDFLGDFCWSFTTTDNTAGILRLGVTDITDFVSTEHFLLTGVFTTTDPSVAESPITGNGELLSDGFHITLTRSMFDGIGITRSVIHAFLDVNTLNGFFDEALTYIDANLASTNTPDSGYRRGDLFPTNCP